MKIEGTYSVAAPRAVVWELLNNPESLGRSIPGCEALVAAGADRYQATIKAGVGAIKGTYSGVVVIRDASPPTSCTLEIQANGTTGFVRGQGRISLDENDGETQVSVDGEGQVGGPVAAVGQRLMGSVAKMMLSEFFRRLNDEAVRRRTGSNG